MAPNRYKKGNPGQWTVNPPVLDWWLYILVVLVRYHQSPHWVRYLIPFYPNITRCRCSYLILFHASHIHPIATNLFAILTLQLSPVIIPTITIKKQWHIINIHHDYMSISVIHKTLDIQIIHCHIWKKSFGGIPNSRNVLFLQFFWSVRSQAGNTSAGFPWIKWPQILLNLTWLCTKASQTFSGTFFGTLLNLTSNPAGTFFGNLLNVTWLCTKADLLRNLVELGSAIAPVHTGAILGWRPP